MSVIAELSIEADQFLLGRVVADVHDLTVEIERVVPTKGRLMPYLWGYGPGLDEFATAMAADEHVAAITVLDEFDDRALYRIEWDVPVRQLIGGLVETEATVLEAHSGDTWTMRLRFENHRGLVAFDDYCTENGIVYELNRVMSLGDAIVAEETAELTGPQYEVLTLALERGYFEVPRRATLSQLASDLGVSVQALSERLRRGTDRALRVALSNRETRHSPAQYGGRRDG